MNARYGASAAFVIATAIAIGCEGESTNTPKPVVPTAATSVVAVVPSTSTSASDSWMSELPPVAPPKESAPAKVVAIPSKLGMKTIGVASDKLPIVYLRVVVGAGDAMGTIMDGTPGAKAGVATLTADLMKEGGAGKYGARELEDRIDTLGADVFVDTSLDRVVFGVAVTKDQLDAALELLAAMVTKPKFDAKEFANLKARTLDRVKQAQTSEGGWLARQVLYRALYGAGHPYAQVDGTATSIASITLDDVKAFYKKAYVLSNATFVAAGDFDPADLGARIDKHFAGFATGAAPVLNFPATKPVGERHVILALKNGSKQADVLVGMLGLARKDEKWPELALSLYALGGGMAARLFKDVRETRSLAYSTSAGARELAKGPSPLVLYSGTKTPDAPKAALALLENMTWIAGGEKLVTDGELADAKVALETNYVYRLETIGSIGSLAIEKEVLGLPGNDVNDAIAIYRKALHDATLAEVRAVAAQVLDANDVVIAVAGDAALAKPLTHFGKVDVVDPAKDFAVVQSLPADPKASLDVVTTP